MPRLKDEVGVQQPESLFIGDLRELTTVYEIGVATLFRNVVHENTTLRRQLLAAGLTPVEKHSTTASDALPVGPTWSLIVPPRPLMPASQDHRSDEEYPEFSFVPAGSKRRQKSRKSKASDCASETTVTQRRSDAASEYLTEAPSYDSEARCARPSRMSNRFMPGAFPSHQLTERTGSLTSDGGTRGSLQGDRWWLRRILKSFAFESFTSGCIILNCITVGIWAHNLTTKSLSSELMRSIEIAEHCFVVVFLLEILLKWKVLHCRAFKPVDSAGRANFADMMLVVFTGVVSAWLVPALGWLFHFDSSAGPFKTLSVLRTFRLARLVRLFQRVPLFREAWMLVHGLSDSGRTLFWTCMIIFLVTYVFAIVGLATVIVELESQYSYRTDPDDVRTIGELLELMTGLDQMMSVLVQVLVSDSFHSFTRPIVKYIWWSWVFWYSYIAVACVVLMNLVTAIIVENAMETSKENHDHMVSERQAKRQRDIDKMNKLFKAIDADGGGTLSWEEFSMSFDDPDLGKIWKVLDIDQKEAWELFQLLDDGDGEITILEFIEALHRMSGVAQAKDMFRLQKMVLVLMNNLDAVTARSLYKVQAKTGTHGIEFAQAAAPAQ